MPRGPAWTRASTTDSNVAATATVELLSPWVDPVLDAICTWYAEQASLASTEAIPASIILLARPPSAWLTRYGGSCVDCVAWPSSIPLHRRPERSCGIRANTCLANRLRIALWCGRPADDARSRCWSERRAGSRAAQRSRGAGMLLYTPLERDLDWLPELPGCPGKV